jgi:Rps23 Pro-64 3,4-dihydroxylase Tpa1-like proline 4-hydroxylase
MNFPFYHHIIDNFFPIEKAKKLSQEFFDYDDSKWYCYDNFIENKKTINNWYDFPSETYKTFTFLNSLEFIQFLSDKTGIEKLYPDLGLHGGGWHIHSRGGKLNIHLDYSIHPKTGLQRKLNLIIYLTEGWKPEWGGGLELWSHNFETNRPLKKEVTVDNIFNRAIIFDTTQNSWHGLPQPLSCPEGIYRKSLAVYYMTDPSENVDSRQRALYVPTIDQENNKEVLDLIQQRIILKGKNNYA